jgi:hypothetical protein
MPLVSKLEKGAIKITATKNPAPPKVKRDE